MKFTQIILLVIVAAIVAPMLVGCGDKSLPPVETRHKDMSAEEIKGKKGD